MGGGFGGKETRSAPLSCALSVAAQKYCRPIRCMLDRDEDMMLSGSYCNICTDLNVIRFQDSGIRSLENTKLVSRKKAKF